MWFWRLWKYNRNLCFATKLEVVQEIRGIILNDLPFSQKGVEGLLINYSARFTISDKKMSIYSSLHPWRVSWIMSHRIIFRIFHNHSCWVFQALLLGIRLSQNIVVVIITINTRLSTEPLFCFISRIFGQLQYIDNCQMLYDTIGQFQQKFIFVAAFLSKWRS